MRVFESWMAKYGFNFKGQEKAERLAVFIDNMNFVKTMNARRRGFKLGLNKFAHLRFDEFKQKYLGLNLVSRNTSDGSTSGDRVAVSAATLPANVDWRLAGAVTPVKDQGRCGETL